MPCFERRGERLCCVNLPRPVPGLVINYSYLWGYEHRKGQVEGSKDRPCAVVVVVADEPHPRVVVLGVTHTKPPSPEHGIELSLLARRRLGLDERPSWIITREANMFTWPGPDLRPRVADDQSSIALGFLPTALLIELRRRFREHITTHQIRIVPRTND
jgi:hypothetical protein